MASSILETTINSLKDSPVPEDRMRMCSAFNAVLAGFLDTPIAPDDLAPHSIATTVRRMETAIRKKFTSTASPEMDFLNEVFEKARDIPASPPLEAKPTFDAQHVGRLMAGAAKVGRRRERRLTTERVSLKTEEIDSLADAAITKIKRIRGLPRMISLARAEVTNLIETRIDQDGVPPSYASRNNYANDIKDGINNFLTIIGDSCQKKPPTSMPDVANDVGQTAALYGAVKSLIELAMTDPKLLYPSETDDGLKIKLLQKMAAITALSKLGISPHLQVASAR